MSNLQQLIQANPDIAGIGVRVAVYIQNFMAIIIAFTTFSDGYITNLEERTVVAQTSAILITASALFLSAFVQAKTFGMSTYHAMIILNLGWMNSTNTFTYFPLFASKDLDNEHNPTTPNSISHPQHTTTITPSSTFSHNAYNWRSGCINPRTAISSPDSRRIFTKPPFVFGSLHLSMLSAFGLWFWATVDTFCLKEECVPGLPIHTRILGHSVATTSNTLRIISLVIYSALALPLLNVLLIDYVLDFLADLPVRTSGFFLEQICGSYLESTTASTMYCHTYLCILFGIDVVMAVDTEIMIGQTRRFVEAGESQWTFGQTLAIFLLSLPIVEFFRAPRRVNPYEKKEKGKRREVDSFGRLPEHLFSFSNWLRGVLFGGSRINSEALSRDVSRASTADNHVTDRSPA